MVRSSQRLDSSLCERLRTDVLPELLDHLIIFQIEGIGATIVFDKLEHIQRKLAESEVRNCGPQGGKLIAERTDSFGVSRHL